MVNKGSTSEPTRRTNALQKLTQKCNSFTRLKINYSSFLPSVTQLRKGNVFTSVCQEFCRGVYPSMHWVRHPPWSDTTPPPWPIEQTVRILLECIPVSRDFYYMAYS